MVSSVRRIYLASRSPRRRELLNQIGVQFDMLMFGGGNDEVEVCEDRLPGEAPHAYVERVALAKASAGVARIESRRLLNRPVLAADTTIDLDGEVIGKPAGPSEAAALLRRLSGRAHRVLTAVAVADPNRLEHRLSVSEVRFRPLEEGEIRRYVASGDPLDKAGAYGIQGRAGMFVEEIHGSYSGIMGLPLCETAVLLRSFGYPL